MKRIPHSRPLLGRGEQRAASAVIRSGMVAQGKEVACFEREMAMVLERRRAVAVSSGTAALHLALIALGVGERDIVALPSFACAALLHAVDLVGASPRLVDVDPRSFNMDPEDLQRKRHGRLKAVVLPHMFGLPANVEEIASLGLPVIEDCALALGARNRGRPVGALGELAVVSFYATKMITTGEGGMVLGDRARFSRIVEDRRSYDGRPRFGRRFNYKMTDVQAAIGRVQLGRLTSFTRARQRLASLYSHLLEGGPWELPTESDEHVYHRFVLRVRARGAKNLLSRLQRRGIDARRPVFRPLHRYLGLSGFPGADEAHRRALSLPLYPSLPVQDAKRVASELWRSAKERETG